MRVRIWPALPRALNVKSFDDLFISIEDIGHNNEVAPRDLFFFLIFFYKFMESIEFGDKCIFILF